MRFEEARHRISAVKHAYDEISKFTHVFELPIISELLEFAFVQSGLAVDVFTAVRFGNDCVGQASL